MNLLKFRRNIKKTNSENKTHQLAKENSQNELFSQRTIQNTQNETQPGVLNDTVLENTLENMSERKFFFKLIETPEGYIIWNGIELEALGRSDDEINGSDY